MKNANYLDSLYGWATCHEENLSTSCISHGEIQYKEIVKRQWETITFRCAKCLTYLLNINFPLCLTHYSADNSISRTVQLRETSAFHITTPSKIHYIYDANINCILRQFYDPSSLRCITAPITKAREERKKYAPARSALAKYRYLNYLLPQCGRMVSADPLHVVALTRWKWSLDMVRMPPAWSDHMNLFNIIEMVEPEVQRQMDG